MPFAHLHVHTEYSLAAVFYRMVCGLSPVPAAQRLVSDSNPKARTVTPLSLIPI